MFAELGRIGFFARGVLYLALGLVAAQIASGGSRGGEEASQTGALRELADRPFGEAVLWFLVAGLAFYGAWRIATAWRDPEDSDPGLADHAKRIGHAIVGVVYIGVAGQAFQIVTGESSSSGRGGGSSSDKAASTLIDSGFGQLLVVITAVVVLAVGVRLFWRGATRQFMGEDLDHGDIGAVRRRVLEVTGLVGHLARGVSFGLIGWFLLDAVLGYDPEKAVGLDGALNQLAGRSYGSAVLWFVALGFISYGVFVVVASPDKTVDGGV